MGVFSQGYEQALIDARRRPLDRPPAEFTETFVATWNATVQEDLTTSEVLNLSEKRAERRAKVLKLTGEDISSLEGQAIPQKSMSEVGRSAEGREIVRRYERKLTDLATQYPGEVLTEEEMLAAIIEDSKLVRERTGKVLENATFSGKIGGFAGAMATSVMDPFILASMFFGASISAGILRTALTEAGINVVSETMIQPFVAQYKQEIESPYTLEDALMRVGAAAGGGFILGGLGRGVQRGVQRGIARLRKPKVPGLDDVLSEAKKIPNLTPEEREAVEFLEDYTDIVRESPFDLGDPDADLAHMKAAGKAIADVEEGRAPDVQEIVRGLEPREAIEPPGQRRTLVVEQDKTGQVKTRTVIVGEPRPPTNATTDQSLGQFVKNSGGVSVEKAGDLRGEYDALFEGGGRTSGSVKRKAGLSPDEMAQRAHEAGFIDEPDTALLAEALLQDISGDKVFSSQSARAARKWDLEIDREFERWAEAEEAAYLRELDAQAKGILEEESVEIAVGELVEEGNIFPVMRSAREVIEEADVDFKAGNIVSKCLLGG